MYEKSNEELIGSSKFLFRMVKSFSATLVIVAVSLTWGTLGYRYFGEMPWDDAFLNASMILTGMGPVNPMKSTGGKLFSASYALYSGLAFLSMVAIVTAPVLHRFLHHFHLEDE